MRKHHTLLIIGLLSCVLLFTFIFTAVIYRDSDFGKGESEASNAVAFTTQSVNSALTQVESDSASVHFSVTSPDLSSGLYTLESDSAGAVVAFLDRKPSYTVSTSGAQETLIPVSSEKLRLVERLTDQELSTPGMFDVEGNNTHYYFDQTECGVPVYGAHTNVHVNKQAQVYALSGSLMKNEADCSRNLSNDQAEGIAIAAYAQDYPEEAESDPKGAQARAAFDTVYSGRIMDAGFDQAFLTRYIEVCTQLYCHAYFVNLSSGDVLDDLPITTDAKNRYVYLEGSGTQRRENDGPVSNASVNKMFDILGEVYDHYQTNYQRDSFDDRGGMMQGHLQSCNQIQASWDGREIFACTGVVSRDVIAHEFQHGVTQHTAGLVYRNESGALNESLSDVFGAAVDSNDWLMGEDSIRAIRSLQNPPQFQHPDSLYSRYYYCGSQDNGGVHINSGVFNKAFYLMADGGRFPSSNGCQVNGIGRQEAANLVYKALTAYMRSKTGGNYRDMYNAMNQACADIYQAGSSQCQNVKAAMEATLMDQQTSGKSTGPKCRGVVEKPPTCAGNTAPTNGPTPTVTQQPSPTTNPTTQPTSNPTVGPTQDPQSTPTPQPSVTQQPTPTPVPSVELPLLSVVSAPLFVTGTVEIADGLQASLESRITTTFFNDLMEQFGDENGPSSRFATEALDEGQLRGRLIGSTTLETGVFTTENNMYVNRFSTPTSISGYNVYEVYIAENPDYPELSLLVADVSEEGGAFDTQVNLRLKLQGIERKPRATQAQVVRIGVGGGELQDTTYTYGVFKPDEQGFWLGQVGFNIPQSSSYKLLVKGPQHVQKKYCSNSPSEEGPGAYVCEQEAVTLGKGTNNIDLARVVQLAGDINQDGVVNAFDILIIRENIGSNLPDDVARGDVNHDGVVNAVDDSLVIFTLSNRTDQS